MGPGVGAPPLLERVRDLARGVEGGARIRLAVFVVRVGQRLRLLEAVELGFPLRGPGLAAVAVDLPELVLEHAARLARLVAPAS